MANFADYVKNDELEQELEEAQSRKPEIPESVLKRFDGKSQDEILESYYHLEQKLSRQGEDMGRLRQTVDQLIELQSQAPAPSTDDTAEPVAPVTVDDLYDDTEGAISRVASKSVKAVDERVNQLESELVKAKQKEALAALESQFPGWKEDVHSEEFVDWVKESRARTRLAMAADQYDFDAASDLLELWNDRKNREQKVENQVKRKQQLRDATLESSSPAALDVPQTYSRHELLEQRIRAKQGDLKAERWLQSHADSIAVAYEEGRITD